MTIFAQIRDISGLKKEAKAGKKTKHRTSNNKNDQAKEKQLVQISVISGLH